MNLKTIAQKRAIAHLIFIPIISFLVTYIFAKGLCLIFPIGYLFLITILQYLRLINTTKRHLKYFSMYYFRALKKLLIVLFFVVVSIFLGVASWVKI